MDNLTLNCKNAQQQLDLIMQKSLTIFHKKTNRQFIISTKTKPNTFRNLIKKALNLQSQIKYFKSSDQKFKLEQLISKATHGQEYEVFLEDESSEQRPLSQVCSQKNMSRVSGRKNPPSEKELLDSKFYIDDFQLFMSQISGPKNNRFLGIVFFNNRKRASFLGKKILRELIFQFDKIEFFYALHPIKMHSTSALLGEVLMFSLFKGKKMLHERQFPQQITAADQILNYLKNLVRLGEINFDSTEPKKPKNLIHVQQQRSFDQKIQNSPEKLSDFGGRPNRTAEIIKIKPVTPDKQIRSRKIFMNPKPQSPIKSHITNQISFQNDLYQPQWFFEGDALNRLEKGVLSALIKVNDSSLLTFLNGLNLKTTQKQALNIKLVKVYLNEFIGQKFSNFSSEQRKIIEQNQQNRKSGVFTALLKLYKFGDFKDFVDTISKEIIKIQEQRRKSQQDSVKYSSIAKNTDKNKTGFKLKLVDCQHGNQTRSPRNQISSPFRLNQMVRNQHSVIAAFFHKKALQPIPSSSIKDIDFQNNYNQAQRAGICDLICKNDAFMIESFIRNPQRAKKMQKMNFKDVTKYMRQVQSRYVNIRQRTVIDTQLQLKMHKLQIFNGLVYYLYKQRIINKKQLKISFYLYTWSDLNILASFEVYLADRNLEEFVDTLYCIDYNYYLHGLYEIDHSEVEQFNIQIQSQLIILFLYEQEIHSGSERMSLEKFIRAGDTSLLKLYTNMQISNQQMIDGILFLTRQKTQELINLNRKESIRQNTQKQKKKERCDFADQIISNRYRNFNKKELVYYCINHKQPQINAIFDQLDKNNDQQKWISSFNEYVNNIDQIHKNTLMNNLALQANLDAQKLKQCSSDIIQGIYEAYLITKDKQDTMDSLQRIIRKQLRSNAQ